MHNALEWDKIISQSHYRLRAKFTTGVTGLDGGREPPTVNVARTKRIALYVAQSIELNWRAHLERYMQRWTFIQIEKPSYTLNKQYWDVLAENGLLRLKNNATVCTPSVWPQFEMISFLVIINDESTPYGWWMIKLALSCLRVLFFFAI